MLYYLGKAFMYISFAYLMWVGYMAEISLFNKTFVKNKKYIGYVISGVLGDILAIIALILDNYYIIIIALILPFVFVKIFGGEPELIENRRKC